MIYYFFQSVHTLIFILCFVFSHIPCIFLNFQLLAKILYTSKMIKRINFMSPCKIFHLFQVVVANFFPQMWIMGRGVGQDLENKDSRSSAIFLINRTQLNSKNHLLLKHQISIVFRKIKYIHTYIHT